MTIVQKIALTLTIVGALNWGLVGIFEFNLVSFIFGSNTSILSKITYSLIGLAGIINVALLTIPNDD